MFVILFGFKKSLIIFNDLSSHLAFTVVETESQNPPRLSPTLYSLLCSHFSSDFLRIESRTGWVSCSLCSPPLATLVTLQLLLSTPLWGVFSSAYF